MLPALIRDELRQKIRVLEGGAAGGPADRSERFPFSLLGAHGFPCGALAQITGSGKTELVVRFLAENPKLRVAWIEEEFSVDPCAVFQRQVDPARVLFVEAGKESAWAALEILRSQLFQIVVLHTTTPTAQGVRERVLRRLQLAAEKARAGLILLSGELMAGTRAGGGLLQQQQQVWPVSLELRASRSHWERLPELEVLRARFGIEGA